MMREQCAMQHAPACVWTSVALLLVALLRCAQRVTVLNLLLVVLGVVSILNHARLDTDTTEWCIPDALHMLDVICVFMAGLLLIREYGVRTAHLIVAAYALFMYILLRRGVIHFNCMAPCWASVHILFILTLCCIR